uniref:CHCH domain-containing protein n=1 Tax=Neobodo designis TaxID=312471 RepID=A0A7S1LQ21_NEODS|mmetsp:Transcript_26176/g.80849  ORF Transcript_26176/g.80849 Transcript_26176/m.80849 type:complete len:152 (+) Transcript_26176:149-604(+)
MGRSRRGSGAGFTRSASASRPSRPASAAHASTPPRQQSPPPAYPVYATGVPAFQNRGPGLMGMMGASMAGSLAGNALAHHMFTSAPQPKSADGVQEMKKVMDESPCAVQFDMYAKCMEHNGNNAEACQWAWDSVAQCRTKALQEAGQSPQA